MEMHAYLGPNLPETLASGEGDPAHEFAVVKDDAVDGVSWVGTFPDEASAIDAYKDQWSATSFGIVCQFRPADPADVAEFIAARPDLRVAVYPVNFRG